MLLMFLDLQVRGQCHTVAEHTGPQVSVSHNDLEAIFHALLLGFTPITAQFEKLYISMINLQTHYGIFS